MVIEHSANGLDNLGLIVAYLLYQGEDLGGD